MPDIAIPIAFPDYLISVNTPKAVLNIPDFFPGFDVLPDKLQIPEFKDKFSQLGHAGILLIDGKKGTTKYYEYGRYGGAIGSVRKVSIRDVKVVDGGHPSKLSLIYTLSQISVNAGQSTRILGAYIEAPGKYNAMLDYAQKRMLENTNPNRKKYDLMFNSCNHFMQGALEAAGIDTPYMFDPRPNSYIEEIRSSFPKLDYSRAEHKLVVENAPKSLAMNIPTYSQPAAV